MELKNQGFADIDAHVEDGILFFLFFCVEQKLIQILFFLGKVLEIADGQHSWGRGFARHYCVDMDEVIHLTVQGVRANYEWSGPAYITTTGNGKIFFQICDHKK